LKHFTAILNIWLTFWIFYDHLVHFVFIIYIFPVLVPRKIWQPWSWVEKKFDIIVAWKDFNWGQGLNTLEGKNASHRISTSVRENWLQIMTIEKNRNGPTKSCTRKSLIRNLRTPGANPTTFEFTATTPAL
jgi:hypothetical protein